jgi:hypothetical protein
MADFDPYYQWLAISPRDQPPNHYRLLGVDLFESNGDVIASAADKQMAHVRSFQTGKYSALSQKLLNEIAAAKICLLNAAKKDAYDQQLRQKSVAPLAPPIAPSPAGRTAAAPLDPPVVPPAPPVAPSPPAARRAVGWDFPQAPPVAHRAKPPAPPKLPPNKKQIWLGTAMIAAAALVLIMVFLILSSRHGKEVASTEQPLPSAATKLLPVPSESQDRPKESIAPVVQPAGPRDEPPRESAKPMVSADSTRPGDADPKAAAAKPAESAPSPVAATEAKAPPAKGGVAVEEQANPGEPAQRPPVKPDIADAATGPQEKMPEPEVSTGPPERLAVPDEAAGRQALAVIRETYKEDYRSADKFSLAHKLLVKADGSRSDPVARFELLQEAKKVASETNLPEWALEAADALASEYEIPAAEMKAKIVDQAAKMLPADRRYLQERQAVAEVALQVIDEAVAEDNFPVARQMGQQAIKLSNDREFIQDVRAKNSEVEAAAKVYERVQEAMKTLKLNPRDAAANLIVGKYLCFTKGDWTNGLPMLALGNDAVLKALAADDIQGPASNVEQVKLGDAWWKVAKQRAVYWYAKAEPGADSQLQKDTLEKLIREGTEKTRWVRIFRSADPSRWNVDPAAGGGKVPDNIKYLKIQPIGRKRSVIIEMSNERLGQDEPLSPASNRKFAWMGANQFNAGARHLGIFLKDGQTGWGFGPAPGGAGQAYAWAGQAIPVAVFEIDVTSDYLTAKEESYLLK